ncbi:hypothetical protein D9611_014469 [Ephemerocybe angulata]|uniref:Uncharacterized protein n=1 Tax=Ephemerocybe angulata TaxID=980116 RepID=A0A8H5FFE0_9AGAR|nr:hypothetical protein D9611_014469 [Tulosesus angulatus]
MHSSMSSESRENVPQNDGASSPAQQSSPNRYRLASRDIENTAPSSSRRTKLGRGSSSDADRASSPSGEKGKYVADSRPTEDRAIVHPPAPPARRVFSAIPKVGYNPWASK